MSKKSQDQPAEGATLSDFVVPQKLTAFISHFLPADETTATEKFDEIRLRSFFKAYPLSLGDPLSVYADRLADAGYSMQVDVAANEPVIYVRERNVRPLIEADIL